MTNAVIPGVIAGVIYLVIALATGASAVASIIGGIVVAATAITIGLVSRAIFIRRAKSRREWIVAARCRTSFCTAGGGGLGVSGSRGPLRPERNSPAAGSRPCR
jgi:hypothetical protein